MEHFNNQLFLSSTTTAPSQAFQIYHAFWMLMDGIYPPTCPGCGRFGYRLCSACMEDIIPFSASVCNRCGAPLRSPSQKHPCLPPECGIAGFRSWAPFKDPLRKVLHSLKYQRNLGVGEVLAASLAGMVHQEGWRVHMVIPVPLGRRRQRERGYNQTAQIAHPLALMLRRPYRPNAIWRSRETSSQIKMNRRERFDNVNQAFSADEEQVSGRTILIIDDVATTGATISECARALKNARAKEVYCLTVARAVLQDDL